MSIGPIGRKKGHIVFEIGLFRRAAWVCCCLLKAENAQFCLASFGFRRNHMTK